MISRLFRRRTRSGKTVRRHWEDDFPVGIETGVWSPASGFRVITHGWKMKPGEWMRSLWWLVEQHTAAGRISFRPFPSQRFYHYPVSFTPGDGFPLWTLLICFLLEGGCFQWIFISFSFLSFIAHSLLFSCLGREMLYIKIIIILFYSSSNLYPAHYKCMGPTSQVHFITVSSYWERNLMFSSYLP